MDLPLTYTSALTKWSAAMSYSDSAAAWYLHHTKCPSSIPDSFWVLLPGCVHPSRVARKGLTTSRTPRMVGMREEKRRGIRMRGLERMAAITRGAFPTPSTMRRAPSTRGRKERLPEPRDRENGKRHGEDGQKEVPFRCLSGFTSLEIPPQMADGISCGACGQRPHKD